MNPFHQVVGKSISDAFKKLLSERHLYQFVEPDPTIVAKQAENVRKTLTRPFPRPGSQPDRIRPPVEEITPMGLQLYNRVWIPLHAAFTPSAKVTTQGQQYVQFEIPHIDAFCSNCEGTWPANPTDDCVCLGEGQDQWFFFGYICQKCHGTPMRFAMRREGLKLRLIGRDPIEVLPIPKEIPKVVGKFFSNAQIAHHASQTLAGIFLLRTVIEQYWRSLEPIKQLIASQPRATGEEQGEVYQQTLPENFRSQFPSLLDLYRRLSAAMHEAKSDDAVFDECAAKLIKHFKARELVDP